MRPWCLHLPPPPAPRRRLPLLLSGRVYRGERERDRERYGDRDKDRHRHRDRHRDRHSETETVREGEMSALRFIASLLCSLPEASFSRHQCNQSWMWPSPAPTRPSPTSLQPRKSGSVPSCSIGDHGGLGFRFRVSMRGLGFRVKGFDEWFRV